MPGPSWTREPWARRSLAALGWGLLPALLGAACISIAMVSDLEDSLGLHWLFTLRGPIPAPQNVVVVALDELSEPDPQRPRSWPRQDQAAVVRYLAEQGARVISFDLTFVSPARDPADDLAFAEAIRTAGNVLLTEAMHSVDEHVIIETPPIPILAEAALGHAPFLLPKESRIDRYWSHVQRKAGGTPTLPVLAFHAFEAADKPVLEKRRLIHDWMSRPTEDASTYLNYYGPPRSIATIPHAVVLARAKGEATGPAAAPLSFRDKAVFIGFSAATQRAQDQLRDSYPTVYAQPDGLDISGVEIAATAFANLSEGRPVQPVSRTAGMLIVIGWGLFVGIACRWLRPAQAAGLMACAAATYLGLAYSRFATTALWMPTIIPVGIQTPLALFVGVWLHHRDSAREREVIKRAFSYFLPSAVVEQLAQKLGPVTGGNKVVFGACLATDVENYTTLAEHMEPGRLGELMNAYYSQLFVPVERSQGVVVDVVGDAMVAVWAKASSPVDVGTRACSAALAIVDALERFNAAPAGRPLLTTRLGLHTGDMLVGSIGGSGHYEYRAVGDVINTSSRIQALNKVLGTRLLASQETVADLPAFATRALGTYLLAGKTRPVSIVELLGVEAEQSSERRALRASFAEALARYHDRQWADAAARFAAVLAAAPGDGPARFFARRCAELLATPPGEDWSPTVLIDMK
jgi:adenylate cyclase